MDPNKNQHIRYSFAGCSISEEGGIAIGRSLPSIPLLGYFVCWDWGDSSEYFGRDYERSSTGGVILDSSCSSIAESLSKCARLRRLHLGISLLRDVCIRIDVCIRMEPCPCACPRPICLFCISVARVRADVCVRVRTCP